MTGQDVFSKPHTSHFGSTSHGREDIIFHPHIFCNDGDYCLLDGDDWTGNIVGLDSLAIPTV